MPTVNVRIKAVHAQNFNRPFEASVEATNRNNGSKTVDDIPLAGGLFTLEVGGRYNFVATPRNTNFQNGRRINVPIRDNTRLIRVLIAPMGEECRVWFENKKTLIVKGEHQKANREIRFAKRV